jgi:cysteine desulfurase / selenocysteine lyase
MNRAATIPHSKATFDVEAIRRDFPILSTRVKGKPLVYLDNAATSQKPQAVIDRMVEYYTTENSNIHRGVHHLSEVATSAYEKARDTIQHFINARDRKEVIFTRGATEGINLVAQSYGRKHIEAGDEILITSIEHHSNIVPWQILCEEKGAKLRVAPIDSTGTVDMDEFRNLLSPRTALVSVTHISNALGTINPITEMITLAHERGVPVLIDGAQAVPHVQIDVQALDCDFYTFSGHKLFAPTGIGVLYGKERVLEQMTPYQAGGDMIASVSFEKTVYNVLPYRFEAGTPHIAGVIGLGAAVEYLQSVGMDAIAAYESELLDYGTEALASVPQIRQIGTAANKASILSFVMEDVHPHDIGTILDHEGIAIRTGHHCAQPVMECFKVPATARASLAFYNTREEIDALVRGLHKVVEVFG